MTFLLSEVLTYYGAGLVDYRGRTIIMDTALAWPNFQMIFEEMC